MKYGTKNVNPQPEKKNHINKKKQMFKDRADKQFEYTRIITQEIKTHAL